MTTEGLTRKKRIRAGHKASATKLLSKLDDLRTESDSSGTPIDTSKLLRIKLSLEEKLGTLKTLDSEILDLTKEDDLGDEIEQADSFKEGIYAAMVEIGKLCAAAPAAATSVAPPPTHTTPPTADASRVKLPKLSLKPFSGDITTWTTFWDSYESAIHKSSALSDIDKFNYLKSLLDRTAHEAIAGLTLTSANYHEAVTILQKRFGNKQQIISRHMEIMLNASPITSQNNLIGLRRLHDQIESNVRGLKSLGVAPESYGSLLSSVLLSKLPQELRLIISRNTGDDSWSLDHLMKELEQELEARERAATNSTNVTQPGRQVRDQHTAAALLSSSSGTSKPFCSYCQQPHPSGACTLVTEPDSRKQILRSSGRCFVCLRKGHISKDCRSKSKCPKCGGRHHFSICLKTRSREGRSEPSTHSSTVSGSNSAPSPRLDPEATPFVAPPTTTTSMYVNASKTVLLQTARTSVYNPQEPRSSLEVRAVLDAGSQRSYITTKVKNLLRLVPKGQQSMSILTFGSTQRLDQSCEIVQIGMKLRDGSDQFLELFTVPTICEPLTSQPIALCTGKYGHLSQLELADYSDGDSEMSVDILIGADHYWNLTTGRTVRGESGPVAIHTKLGWVLSGPTPFTGASPHSASLITSHTLHVGISTPDVKSLDDTLRSFWELEAMGIKDPGQSVLTQFEERIKFRDGRYEVALPWKDPHPTLPTNYHLCLNRLNGLYRRLRQTPALLKEYDTTIQNQVRQGIVQRVDEPEATKGDNVHYLPHHAVIRQDKETTKLRIVYDASAKSTGPSLNNCLYTGPKFDQKILDILLRFRTYKVALIADIEKAFLMVSMSESDRDVLRFLWYDDVAKEQPEVRVFRFTRVVFGVSSSPFLLNATISHHLNEFASSEPQLVRTLLRSTYVDDIVTGAKDEDDAYELYVKSKKMLKSGGFNLRKFVTSSSRLQERINNTEGTVGASSTLNSETTYAKETLGVSQRPLQGEHKVLGVRWNVTADCLAFDVLTIATAAKDLVPTKRNIVSVVGKFYDPLGVLSPIVIQFKILFQQLCESKIEWDQPLSGELLLKWKSLISMLQGGPQISLPRCFLDGVSEEVESYTLHGFCDASKKAYAAVVYLVTKTSAGSHVNFLASKTRVSPIAGQTIPRLELLSALLLARLIVSISSSLEPELALAQPVCYTDSKVALYWILGFDKEWKQFVQNRVCEIRKLLPRARWRHCRGLDNPADLPSRGLSPSELFVSDLWWHGPSSLDETSSESEDNEDSVPPECISEMKIKDQKLCHNLLVTEKQAEIAQVIECQRYCSMQKLLGVTAYVLKFVNKLKSKTCDQAQHSPSTLTAGEIATAESLWIKEAQSRLVEDSKFIHWKKQLELFCDPNGIWRCGGRISNADISYSAKHPTMLPRHHPLTTLIVKNAHEKVFHNGVKETLTEVRSRFWILKGRSLVKAIIRQCGLCRRFEGKPYIAQPSPPLPKFRVKEEPPFTYTGVDFAGPLYVKSNSTTGSGKVWLCLYTCCVVRAVHLDIVCDMTTSAFLRSFKRFTARRGLPLKIISDNGKTFKAAAKTIDAVIRHEDVQRHFAGIGVDWLFNIEKAPWWGGMFERMIRSTKRCLKKVIGRAKLDYDELLTIVTEVEMIINSRPLSYVTPDDLEEPLTPAHFLTGKRTMSLPDSLCHEQDWDDDIQVSVPLLSKRMRHLNSILNHFWSRWRGEYLLELRESHRYSASEPHAATITVGDIVLVHEDAPRALWRLAKVEELITGRDGHTRGAIIRVSGKNHSKLFRRPIQRLYPIETNCRRSGSPRANTLMPDAEEVQPLVIANDSEDAGARDRPKRVAAIAAADRVKAVAVYENQ